ncbi:YqiA/YcfP family alpha/beta fold hydrolase [Marinibactrum halimedae]|uniref:Esterase YqiA n=1 Tax=Marinibactrum halimedae TaxID=1444977 RepID=A0AA37WMD8_9GAMM|nr:YqiA/YcfP family alpha/beta fold hydrolase [Marinibactrum halimedae]MCD9457750.1 alpha/beta hydrolase [Marinibactrum halimedae]GLS24876.1 esterase YqiA [Marinibactrum halimedae]
MSTLLYIHGFLSSPSSFKSQQFKQWLTQHRPDIHFECPLLPPYPAQAHQILDNIITQSAERPIYLVGSSMGGFWSTYFAEKYNLPAVLVNPACAPLTLMPSYVGIELKNFHTEDTYLLNDSHLKELAEFVIEEPQRIPNYWVLLQTGDETLDYRLAEKKYRKCKVTTEDGGDHSFAGFERYFENIIRFFEDIHSAR